MHQYTKRVDSKAAVSYEVKDFIRTSGHVISIEDDRGGEGGWVLTLTEYSGAPLRHHYLSAHGWSKVQP